MKTNFRIASRFLIVSLCIVAIACSKEDSDSITNPEGEVEELAPSISTSEFETDEGQIGISLSAREIARRGYKPVTAVISIASSSSIEDQTISFDEYSNLAILSFENDTLDDTIESELKDGVAVQVTVRDVNDAVLATQDFTKLSFKPSPEDEEIGAEGLDDLFAEISLRSDLKYYVQVVNKENEVIAAPGSQGYLVENSVSRGMQVMTDLNYAEDPEYFDNFTTYYFEKIPNNEGYYSMAVKNENDIHYLYMSGTRLNIQTRENLERNVTNTNVEFFTNYWFKIIKEGPGFFSIVPFDTVNPLVISGSNFVIASNNSPTDPNYFRILLFDIDWDVQVVDSQFSKPIMPPSATNSAYNSTLRNCSSGTLTQTVGESTTIGTTQVAGYEETMSVSTTNTAGVEVSVQVAYEAEAKFFGSGTKQSISGSITGSYEYSKTATETNTRSESLSTEKSVEVSVSREVGVPPGTAIAVADIYQQYQNIRVPFVQKFRISGKYQENDIPLTGQEISTQFAFNSFTGVITEVDAEYIEVTVRGNTIIDRIIETSTETRDIANSCTN